MCIRDSTTTIPYTLTRLHTIMSPEPGNPFEVEGVLNPASGRTPDGQLYLLPRLVAEGNVSRVGIARMVLADGVPVGVEREGVVLAPDAGWEHGLHPVSYTHLRAHETRHDLVCRLLL